VSVRMQAPRPAVRGSSEHAVLAALSSVKPVQAVRMDRIRPDYPVPPLRERAPARVAASSGISGRIRTIRTDHLSMEEFMTTNSTPNGPAGDDPAALAAYLAANPGKTPRDYKGKGGFVFDKYHVGPNELPFDRLDRDHVRCRVDGVPARYLPRNLRQAAGRDPALAWDEATRAYRLAPARKAGERCAAAASTSAWPTPASAPSHARAATSTVSKGPGGLESQRAAKTATGRCPER